MDRRLGVCIVTGLIALTGCSGDDTGTPTTSTPQTTTAVTTAPTTTSPTTTALSTTTAASTTTTTAASTTTSGSPDAVGDPEALEQLVLEVATAVERFSAEVVTMDVPLDPPIPDLTNPDPGVALAEIFDFIAYAASVVPSDDWLQIYVVPGSQAEQTYARNFDNLFFDFLVLEIADPGVVVSDVETVEVAESDMPADIAESLPDDAVVLRFVNTVGPRTYLDSRSGEVRDTDDGWTDVTEYAALVPSETGWRIAYETEGTP